MSWYHRRYHYISIHAPTRGATYLPVTVSGGNAISIHAPTRGATGKAKAKAGRDVFQSTLPRGERQDLSDNNHSQYNFNPRSHEGSDPQVHSSFLILHDFNPRSHEGSDHGIYNRVKADDDFNPRSHEGSDIVPTAYTMSLYRFQSTLPRGERHVIGIPCISGWDFNPRSHEGSDQQGGSYPQGSLYFNPRSHEGSDKACKAFRSNQHLFQSTLPRGERHQFSPKSSLFSQQKLSKIFNLNNKLF